MVVKEASSSTCKDQKDRFSQVKRLEEKICHIEVISGRIEDRPRKIHTQFQIFEHDSWKSTCRI